MEMDHPDFVRVDKWDDFLIAYMRGESFRSLARRNALPWRTLEQATADPEYRRRMVERYLRNHRLALAKEERYRRPLGEKQPESHALMKPLA
jgi:hypothetical protein